MTPALITAMKEALAGKEYNLNRPFRDSCIYFHLGTATTFTLDGKRVPESVFTEGYDTFNLIALSGTACDLSEKPDLGANFVLTHLSVETPIPRDFGNPKSCTWRVLPVAEGDGASDGMGSPARSPSRLSTTTTSTSRHSSGSDLAPSSSSAFPPPPL
jgi:hypothetical protein